MGLENLLVNVICVCGDIGSVQCPPVRVPVLRRPQSAFQQIVPPQSVPQKIAPPESVSSQTV